MAATMGNMPREAEGLLGPSRGVLGEAEDGRGARDGGSLGRE